jgi:hypothetical protein
MSSVNYVNVISGTPASTTSIALGIPGVGIVWSTTKSWTQYGSSSSTSTPQTNLITQSTNVLMLDGYSSTTGAQNNSCTSFTGILNFTLANPLFTDDETDVIYLYVVFPTSTGTIYNSGVTFDITCSLCNLGSMVSSPVYTVTTTTGTSTAGPYLVIPINKWFAFRAPGSIYQIRIEGFST